MQRVIPFLIVLLLASCLNAGVPIPISPMPQPKSTGPPGPAEPLVIVVNRSNPVNNLSFTELRRVFLGERSHWGNDRRITLVFRDPGELERNVILRDVCGMNEDELKTHFLRGLFTGEILVSPKILSTPTGVRKFIFNVPGAIGYLRISDVDDSVKVVRLDELLPNDKGYRLHVESRSGK